MRPRPPSHGKETVPVLFGASRASIACAECARVEKHGVAEGSNATQTWKRQADDGVPPFALLHTCHFLFNFPLAPPS